MDWAKTIAVRDEKHLSFQISFGVLYTRSFTVHVFIMMSCVIPGMHLCGVLSQLLSRIHAGGTLYRRPDTACHERRPHLQQPESSAGEWACCQLSIHIWLCDF